MPFQRSAFADALQKTAFLDWAEESRALAKSVVYRDRDEFLKFEPLPDR